MKRNISIHLKAAFLLVIFGLNTIVGFACAVGVDMGFNASHHDEAEDVSVHMHADGKKHLHSTEADKDHHDKKDASENHGCCNDKVISLQNLDKNLVQNANATIDVPVFILTSSFGAYSFKVPPVVPRKFIVPTSHPPPSDIRVAIRSFQI